MYTAIKLTCRAESDKYIIFQMNGTYYFDTNLTFEGTYFLLLRIRADKNHHLELFRIKSHTTRWIQHNVIVSPFYHFAAQLTKSKLPDHIYHIQNYLISHGL
jgi:hypothetical protein